MDLNLILLPPSPAPHTLNPIQTPQRPLHPPRLPKPPNKTRPKHNKKPPILTPNLPNPNLHPPPTLIPNPPPNDGHSYNDDFV